jgi:anti-sigma factor RsiW
VTCREFVEFLNAYLDGELAAHERAEFDRHLAICTACVHYLASYEQTTALARAALAGADQPPPEVPEELIAAILGARGRGE